MRPRGEATGRWFLNSLGCMAAIVLSFYFIASWLGRALGPVKEIGRSAQCQENVRMLLRAQAMYADDYEDHLPPGRNWMDRIDFFLDKTRRDPTRCPEVVETEPQGYGYGMNSDLGGKARAKILDFETEPVAFDSSDVRKSAVAPGKALPLPARHPGRVKKGEPFKRGAWVGLGAGGIKFQTPTSPAKG